MQHNCAVCLEYLFDSCKPISVLQCGHTMHAECLDVCPGSLPCVLSGAIAAWDEASGCGLTQDSLQGHMMLNVSYTPCLLHYLPHGHSLLEHTMLYLLAKLTPFVCCSCTSGATISTALCAVTLWPRPGSSTRQQCCQPYALNPLNPPGLCMQPVFSTCRTPACSRSEVHLSSVFITPVCNMSNAWMCQGIQWAGVTFITSHRRY